MKAKRPENKMKTQVFGILIAIVFIVFVAIMSYFAKAESSKTIEVVRLKASMNAGQLITADDIEKYDMYYKEFENAGTQKLSDGSKRAVIVTWANREKVIGKRYTSSFLLGKQNLYWSQTTSEQNKKNSYLYSMDGELLNIQMATTNDFGEMVVPGDQINVRVTYTTVDYDLPEEEAYMLASDNGVNLTEGTERTVSEMLFNEVTVLDMLNSDGESIFDIYYDFISMNKANQQVLLNSEDFQERVKPKSILVQATAEEADRFMEVQAKSPQYLITLLPRTNSNAILDSLSDVQQLIQSSGSSSTTNTTK